MLTQYKNMDIMMNLRAFHTHAIPTQPAIAIVCKKNVPTVKCKLFTRPAESGWNLHRTRIRIFYAQHEEKRVNRI